MWLVEIIFTILSVIWLKNHYISSAIPNGGKNVMLGIVICNSVLFFTGVMCIWCFFDVAGRSWVKLKKYQKSQTSKNKKLQYKRSGGNSNRSWRHRFVNFSHILDQPIHLDKGHSLARDCKEEATENGRATGGLSCQR